MQQREMVGLRQDELEPEQEELETEQDDLEPEQDLFDNGLDRKSKFLMFYIRKTLIMKNYKRKIFEMERLEKTSSTNGINNPTNSNATTRNGRFKTRRIRT